jgi:hypothetical protein
MDIAIILTRKFPGAQWTLDGDEYAGLKWSDSTTKPTKKALEDLWPIVQAEIDAEIQSMIDAKASAISKLESLGLTLEEVKVAFGLENNASA